MTTIDGNKQITEFMEDGNNYKAIKCKYKILYDCPQVIEPVEDYFLEYDSSWDWLIPVIDKITDTDEYQVFKDERCTMFSDGSIYINTKYIDTTWIQVIEFIEWYNKQK